MSTLARTPAGDLALVTQANGKKNLSILTDKATACAIKLADRFRIWLGEWFLDTRIGVPYIQTVFVKRPSLSAIRQLFRTIILTTPPIASCDDLQLNYNAARRTLAYSFRATTNDGAIITGGSGQPFIVVKTGA